MSLSSASFHYTKRYVSVKDVFRKYEQSSVSSEFVLGSKEVSIGKLLYSAGSATDLIGRFIVLNQFIAITPSFRILNGFLPIPVALEVSQFLISFTTFSNDAIWSLNFTLSFACLCKTYSLPSAEPLSLNFRFFFWSDFTKIRSNHRMCSVKKGV